MKTTPDPVWREPEELIEIGFGRSPIVMINEAHNGSRRCIRTRQIGQQILPKAHHIGVRHLAMEALNPHFAQQANRTRQIPDAKGGYLSQPEMRSLIQSSLELGWTLIAYEADLTRYLATEHGIPNSDNPQVLGKQLQAMEAKMRSMEFVNWREEQQARNLIAALDALPADTRLLAWCGNGHHTKSVIKKWIPMGYQFQQLSGIIPFVIDQTLTVNRATQSGMPLVNRFRAELVKRNGTAGFLREHVPAGLPEAFTADAFLLSLYNEME